VIAHPAGQNWQVGASIQLRVEDASIGQYRTGVAHARESLQAGVPFDADVDGARETYAVEQDGYSFLVYALARDAAFDVLLIARLRGR
jgi:hypothetical protein